MPETAAPATVGASPTLSSTSSYDVLVVALVGCKSASEEPDESEREHVDYVMSLEGRSQTVPVEGEEGESAAGPAEAVASFRCVEVSTEDLPNLLALFEQFDGFALVYSTVWLPSFEAVQPVYDAICGCVMSRASRSKTPSIVLAGYMLDDDDMQADQRCISMREGASRAKAM